MKPELYLFHYSFPCAQVLLDQKKIDQAAYNQLKQMFENNQAPSKEVLEAVFKSAFRRIKQTAGKMHKDYWDLEVIKKYFLEEHNKFIDQGEGDYKHFGEDFKEICKVYTVEIVEKQGRILIVKHNDKLQKVLGDLLPHAKIGDKVTIHLGFAIEII